MADPDCRASHLRLTLRHEPGAGGEGFALVILASTAKHTCLLSGYAGVSTYRGGHRVGKPAKRAKGHGVYGRPHSVKLTPGHRASAVYTDNEGDCSSLSKTVRVYPPNNTKYLTRHFTFPTCFQGIGPFYEGTHGPQHH
jgi:hypothetical protein